MTYAQAIQFLCDLSLFGAELGLANTRRLAARAGSPQNQLRFIHVAGTNGKGSTCAMLESIYRAAGLRVGLFTSPHLVSFRERIQVNRRLISEADVVRLVAELERGSVTRSTPRADDTFEPPAALDEAKRCGSQTRAPGDRRAAGPTYFEVITVMALTYFAEQECELVIWETGLGGRLDSTNIVLPLASVITNIAYDHQQWLGNTLAEIATEKAGIIKPGVPVLTAANGPEALAVIERIARERNAPLTCVGQVSRLSPSALGNGNETGATPVLRLAGTHQQQNAALAVATVAALQGKIAVSPAAIAEGLSTVQWPGRLQLVTRPGGQKILLDGAHNRAGIETLRAALIGAPSTVSARSNLPSKHAEAVLGAPTLILGVLADKDWRAMCEMLAPLAARIATVTVGSERTTSAAELAAACREANPTAEVFECASLRAALKQTARDRFVVITGSLYLVGEALELLELSTEAGASERNLNEWGGAKPGMPPPPPR